MLFPNTGPYVQELINFYMESIKEIENSKQDSEENLDSENELEKDQENNNRARNNFRERNKLLKAMRDKIVLDYPKFNTTKDHLKAMKQFNLDSVNHPFEPQICLSSFIKALNGLIEFKQQEQQQQNLTRLGATSSSYTRATSRSTESASGVPQRSKHLMR